MRSCSTAEDTAAAERREPLLPARPEQGLVKKVDARDPAARDPGRERPGDRFDFGQLGHATIISQAEGVVDGSHQEER